jgi:three-Cys-motif partner protein
MGNRRFHSQAFDDGTLLKLEIFRGYIREWLPVFLSKKSYPEMHIYDFFAGPGTDAAGNPGSPLVIIDELEQYLMSDKAPLAPDVRVFLHFNDADCDKMVQLEATIRQRTNALPYAVKFTCMEFRLAFFESLQSIQNKDTANLVIMDQCGIKEVNRDIFATLVGCCATDILFFVSSSFIRRFIADESVQQHFNIPEGEMCAVSAKDIHRYVCREFYQKLIPVDHRYHVAPFSIEKDGGANIYGIIFGSGSLFGLEKFLRVCWNKDEITGEANYNIDGDIVRDGQMALLPEDSVIKKQDRFQRDLMEYIRLRKPDNRDLYQFVLENGFLPSHAGAVLRSMQASGSLSVMDIGSGQKARGNAFYLNWNEYSSATPRVRFSLKGTANVV